MPRRHAHFLRLCHSVPTRLARSICPETDCVDKQNCLKGHRSQKQSFPVEGTWWPGRWVVSMPGLLSSKSNERFPRRKHLSSRPNPGQELEKNIAISMRTVTQWPQEASCHRIHKRPSAIEESQTSFLACVYRSHSWNLSIDWKPPSHP